MSGPGAGEAVGGRPVAVEQFAFSFVESLPPPPVAQGGIAPAPARPGRVRRIAVRAPSRFIEAVRACCERRGVSPGEMVTAVRTLMHPRMLASFEDPGEPAASDALVQWRRTAAGRLRRVRQHPTVTVHLREDLDAVTLRRCLAAALALEDPEGWRLLPRATIDAWQAEWRERERRLELDGEHVRDTLQRLAFRILEGGVRTPAQAARILGMASEFGCTPETVNRRFRELAPVFHPDTGLLADPDRMRQLIEARKVLLDFLKT